jgi:hypothetical protein
MSSKVSDMARRRRSKEEDEEEDKEDNKKTSKHSGKGSGKSCKALKQALRDATSRQSRGRALGNYARAGCARRHKRSRKRR